MKLGMAPNLAFIIYVSGAAPSMSLFQNQQNYLPTDLLRFKEARAGDQLLTSFQCNVYPFQILHLRDPVPDLPRDAPLLCCIRWANMDVLWGQEPNPVRANLQGVKHLLCLWTKVDAPPPLPPHRPFPVQGLLGLGIAAALLLKLLEPIKYHHDYQQLRTVESFLLKCLHGISDQSHQSVHCGRGQGQTLPYLEPNTIFVVCTFCPGMHQEDGARCQAG